MRTTRPQLPGGRSSGYGILRPPALILRQLASVRATPEDGCDEIVAGRAIERFLPTRTAPQAKLELPMLRFPPETLERPADESARQIACLLFAEPRAEPLPRLDACRTWGR